MKYTYFIIYMIVFVSIRILTGHLDSTLQNHLIFTVGPCPQSWMLASQFLPSCIQVMCWFSTTRYLCGRHTGSSLGPQLTSCRLISLAVSTWLTHTSKVSLHSLLSLRFVLEEVAFLDQARGARMSGRLSLRKLMDRYTMRKRNHHGVISRTGWILLEQLPVTDRHKSCICKKRGHGQSF